MNGKQAMWSLLPDLPCDHIAIGGRKNATTAIVLIIRRAGAGPDRRCKRVKSHAPLPSLRLRSSPSADRDKFINYLSRSFLRRKGGRMQFA